MSLDNSRVWSKQDLSIIKTIESGTYGVVLLANDIVTDTLVAVKVQSVRNLSRSMVNYTEEIRIQSMLDHPGIVKMYGSFKDIAPEYKWLVDNKLKDDMQHDDMCIYMVMEYCPAGDLFELRLNRISDSDIISIWNQIAEAMKYYFSLGIIHRDIKLENILVISKNPIKVKISDFGFATSARTSNAHLGTLEYMAPELFKYKPYNNKVDIWALGIIIYELFTGSHPFNYGDVDNNKIKSRIMLEEIDFDDVIESSDIRDIIKYLLDRNIENRQLKSPSDILTKSDTETNIESDAKSDVDESDVDESDAKSDVNEADVDESDTKSDTKSDVDEADTESSNDASYVELTNIISSIKINRDSFNGVSGSGSSTVNYTKINT